MKKWQLGFMVIILIGGLYHFLRDVLQVFDFSSTITDLFHREHKWCGSYCDYVTFPIDFLLIAFSITAIRKNKFMPSASFIALTLIVALYMQFAK